MNKHAYLIMAHGSYEQLAFLISLLDHEKNDIFIHIDGKASFTDNDKKLITTSVNYSSVYFVPRIAVYWGGYSQIAAEFSLFNAAYNQGDYYFYHLLSGIDLPLQPQSVIHTFFDKYPDKVFLTMMSLDGDIENINRIKYYHWMEHLTPRTFPGLMGKVIFKLYRNIEIFIQKIIGINRLNTENIIPIKAANWGSFPSNIVKLILENESYISRVFKFSFLADEVFVPYLLDKHGLLNRLYDSHLSYGRKEDFQGNLRYINWWDGNPYTWTDSNRDILELQSARDRGYLFSRKFNTNAFPKLKYVISDMVKES